MDCFHIVTTKDNTDPDHRLPDVDKSVTVPEDLTAEDWSNPWAGATLIEVSAFCSEAMTLDTERWEPSLLLVLDEKGVEEETFDLFHTMDDDDAEEYQLTNADGIEKVRIPWHSAFSMWYNSHVANMNILAVLQTVFDWLQNAILPLWRSQPLGCAICNLAASCVSTTSRQTLDLPAMLSHGISRPPGSSWPPFHIGFSRIPQDICVCYRIDLARHTR